MMAISGKFRFRKATFGNLVLQVEDIRRSWWSSRDRSTWRNAKPIDLAAPEFRLLMDLGHGRPLVPLTRASFATRSNAPDPQHKNGPSHMQQQGRPGSL